MLRNKFSGIVDGKEDTSTRCCEYWNFYKFIALNYSFNLYKSFNTFEKGFRKTKRIKWNFRLFKNAKCCNFMLQMIFNTVLSFVYYLFVSNWTNFENYFIVY